MGSYEAYRLVVEPGERDAETVADELYAALPDALEGALADEDRADDYSRIVDGGLGLKVFVDDQGFVHWRSARVGVPFLFVRDLPKRLDVRGDWALGCWEQEVNYWGIADLFVWDDGWVKQDEERGENGEKGGDAIDTLADRYGVWALPPTDNVAFDAKGYRAHKQDD